MAEAERHLCRHAVIATVVGACPSLEIFEVKRAMAMHFRFQEESVEVTLHTTGEFLLNFTDSRLRDLVLRHHGALHLGRVSFLLTPWSRFRRATPAKLPYKVRVCLEGVPEHEWDVGSVSTLFDPSCIIDGIDHEELSEQESGCLRLWVWMDNIEKLRTRGILRLEEPREVGSPDMHYPDIGMLEEVPARWGQIGLLGTPVLIHLDGVSTSPTRRTPAAAMARETVESAGFRLTSRPFLPGRSSGDTAGTYRMRMGIFRRLLRGDLLTPGCGSQVVAPVAWAAGLATVIGGGSMTMEVMTGHLILRVTTRPPRVVRGRDMALTAVMAAGDMAGRRGMRHRL